MITSPRARQAFDISKEDKAQHEAYGETRFGRGVLLARRLIENGVGFVEVSFGSWDHHRDIFNTVPEKVKCYTPHRKLPRPLTLPLEFVKRKL